MTPPAAPPTVEEATAREIPLSRGLVAIVDESDYALMMSVGAWHVRRGPMTSYAVHKTERNGCLVMHRLILNARPGMLVDHIDCDGLNNRRSNLRFTDYFGSSRNRRKQRIAKASSRYKGVSLDVRYGRWRARIQGSGMTVSLGYFIDEVEAALAYDAAARERFGEFANLNFPPTMVIK